MEELLLALLYTLLPFLGTGECAVAVVVSPGEVLLGAISPSGIGALHGAFLLPGGEASLEAVDPMEILARRISAGRVSFVLSARPCDGIKGGPLLRIFIEPPVTHFSVERCEVVDPHARKLRTFVLVIVESSITLSLKCNSGCKEPHTFL